MQVVVEDDPTPLVLIMGTTLRRSTSDPTVALKAQRLHGVFAVRSKNDPQAVTMRFADGRVELSPVFPRRTLLPAERTVTYRAARDDGHRVER